MSTTPLLRTGNGTKAPGWRLVVIIATVIAALWGLDWFLKNTESSELRNEAGQAYLEGSRLLREGRVPDAVAKLQKAHALARENRAYEIELVRALAAVGKISQAELLLDDVLQHQPNDGLSNLTAARVMLRNGRQTGAEAYYHRAIYGDWSDNPGQHRAQVRMELANLLAREGRQKELLAELLPLEAEAGGAPEVRKQVARLFLAAGSPGHAADAYRALIKENPHDARAHAGLGEAELERGRYRAAQAAFAAAFRENPDDVSIRRRMELSSAVAALDPTPRTLRSAEKYRRALRLVELARAALEQCIGKYPRWATSETAQLLTAARESVPARAPRQITNEDAEEKLALAETMWRRLRSCGGGLSPEEEPLRLIMEKLLQ